MASAEAPLQGVREDGDGVGRGADPAPSPGTRIRPQGPRRSTTRPGRGRGGDDRAAARRRTYVRRREIGHDLLDHALDRATALVAPVRGRRRLRHARRRDALQHGGSPRSSHVTRSCGASLAHQNPSLPFESRHRPGLADSLHGRVVPAPVRHDARGHHCRSRAAVARRAARRPSMAHRQRLIARRLPSP